MTHQTSFPIDFVRQQFPSLAGDWTFFDNAGGSQTLKRVVDRISEYLLTSDSFVVDGINSESIPLQIDKHNIGIRFGDFYAKRLIEDLGLDKQGGVVRVSMVHYNTIEEVDRLIQALEAVL